MVKLLFSRLNMQKHHIDVMKVAVTLLLYALCKVESPVARGEQDQTEIATVLGMCEVCLKDWIKRDDVIGGNYFGKKNQNRMELLYGSSEFKVEHSSYTLCDK